MTDDLESHRLNVMKNRSKLNNPDNVFEDVILKMSFLR